MKKLLNISICLLVVFVSVNFAQKQTRKQTKSNVSLNKKLKNSKSSQDNSNFICQLPASVVALDLSQDEIVLSCLLEDKQCLKNKIIKVTAVAVDTGQEKYVYSVSAGKILGEGANVQWDLSDVKPGSYTITAAISQPIFDGKRWEVLGSPKTKVVVIKE